MSGPLRMRPWDVKKLGEFLAAITAASRDTGVYVGAYSNVDVRVAADAVLSITWDTEDREYRIEDRNGD